MERVRELRVVSEGPKPTLADVEPLRNLLCANPRIPENRTYFQQASAEDVLRMAWGTPDVLVQAGLIPGFDSVRPGADPGAAAPT